MPATNTKILPVFRTLLTAWKLPNGASQRLMRDAALWLRAPADRRPSWSDR